MDYDTLLLAPIFDAELSPHGACCLCGNTGIIDTCERVHTPAGVRVGARVLCICPNGRRMKELGVEA